MTPDTLLAELETRGITLRRSGDRVMVRDPGQALTPGLRAMVRKHKTALMARLNVPDAGEQLKLTAASNPDPWPRLQVEMLPSDPARDRLGWHLLSDPRSVEFRAADRALCLAIDGGNAAAIAGAQLRFDRALAAVRALAAEILSALQGLEDKSAVSAPSGGGAMDAQSDLNVDHIPAELKALRQWVLWKYKTLPSGKTTKPPYQPAGYFAKSNQPRTWSTFGAVLKVASRFDGIGLCFGADVCGIDLDNCFNDDRTLKPWAADIFNELAVPTYTEISPSGRGLHLLYSGEFPAELRGRSFDLAPHEGAAFYAFPSSRYFTVTGQRFGPVTTVTRVAAIDFAPVAYYINEVFPRERKPQAQPAPQVQMGQGDGDILQSMRSAKNAGKVLALLDGDISGYPSASEADLALCTIIAHYTQDAAQIDRVFRSSGLFRDKWNQRRGVRPGQTYGALTIERALKFVRG